MSTVALSDWHVSMMESTVGAGNEPLTFDSWDHQAVKLIIGIQFVSFSLLYNISGEERDGHQVGREAAERVRRQLRVPRRQTVGQLRF